MNKVDIIFRKTKGDGEIVAILPEIPATFTTITCYAHIGQHSDCTYEWIIKDTVPAKPEEYADLLREYQQLLDHIGDGEELSIKSRINHNKWRKAWNK